MRLLIVALTLTVGAMFFASTALASSKHVNHAQGSSWTVLGGNPVVPGGLVAYGNGSGRYGYFKLMTGADGASAMKHAGLNRAARRAFARSAGKGHFRSCRLKYGSKHQKMAFGPHGMFVDTNVVFLDPRYKDHSAPAFCDHVQVSKHVTVTRGKEVLVKTVVNADGSKDLYYDRVDTIRTKTCYIDSLVPVKCGNFAEEKHYCITTVRHVHHRRHVHIPPPPPQTYACVNTDVTPSSIQVGQSVSATTQYSKSSGVTFQSVSYNWGDNTTTTGGATSSHTYNAAGSYTVVATVNFILPNGTPVSATAPTCQGSVNVTPPPPSPPGLSCTAPQEITGGNSVIVKCDVTDGNGAPISLNATSQDSNSQVTGINCYSQGGSPSCQGDGQFEFRVNGFNNTSGVLTTTVKVVAYANGVQSDPVYMTFNVDPSGGGF